MDRINPSITTGGVEEGQAGRQGKAWHGINHDHVVRLEIKDISAMSFTAL